MANRRVTIFQSMLSHFSHNPRCGGPELFRDPPTKFPFRYVDRSNAKVVKFSCLSLQLVVRVLAPDIGILA